MKQSVLLIAALMTVASTVSASSSIYNDMKKFASEIPLTKAEAKQKFQSSAPKHLRQSPEHHQAIYDEAHQRTMALRRKLGMKPLGEGAHANVSQELSQLEGNIGFTLGMVNGLMYHPGSVHICVVAFEGTLVNFDTFAAVASRIYEPWYWADFIVSLQDMVALSSRIYADCTVDKLFNTLTHLISVEGFTELVARALGMIYFEFKDYVDTRNNPVAKSSDKGFQFGRVIAALLKFQV